MHEVVGLIREFPFGSFLIIGMIVGGAYGVVRAFINRNKPSCDCDCCMTEDEEEEE
jgi:hypothetical protein